MSGVAIFITLFWLYVVSIVAFAVWSGIAAGRARAYLLMRAMSARYSRLNKEENNHAD